MQADFSRIKRLPPYVFAITTDLKMAARRKGEDIIDFGMGNPDGPTPKHIVDKLVETAQRGDTHGYSVSKGIPRLRKAICNWYDTRYGAKLDPDTEAIVTIGSKEGLAHLMLATMERGDTVLVPNPSYPIHIYGAIIAGADIRSVRMDGRVDFFAELERAIDLVANDAKSGMDFALAENTEEQSRFAHAANIEARRLNRLVSFFMPLATLVAVFGMSPPVEVIKVPGFWLVIIAGILAGFLIQIIPRGKP